MSQALHKRIDGTLVCDDGWAVRLVTPEMLEYSEGQASCIVNVGFVAHEQLCRIYASESSSEFFPHLREHLQAAAPHLSGRYEVV